MGSGKGGSVTVGYHYYMNVHFSLAHGGVDELLEIRVGDRTAWRGNITGAGSAMVNQPNLFGGEKREGGVLGVVDFMPGDTSQPLNPSLQRAVIRATGATAVPAYRGLSTVFFKGLDGVDLTGTPWDEADKGTVDPSSELPPTTGFSDLLQYASSILSWKSLVRGSFLWSAMNPYFKTPAFLVRRVWKGWYPEKAKIGADVNPVHIIYESLINKTWGLGYPTIDIDDANFRAAADVLYNEGFGLSLKWTKQVRISEFIDLVKEHINANVVEDRETGKFRIILVRDNYDPQNLFELNESNCTLEDFQRKTFGETVNEVTVAYTRPEDGETDTVTVQDLANFSNTGQISSQKKEYPGIRDANLAFKVALRDLNTLSKPVAKCTITCNRSILGHYPGDVVKINWPRLGLNGVVLRIGKMNLGNAQSGQIQIEAVEDMFGLPQSAYMDRQPIGWVDPSQDTEPVNNQKLYELSYYELYTGTDSSDRLDWPSDVGFVAVSGQAPNSDADSMSLLDTTTEQVVAGGELTPVITLTTDCTHMQSTLQVDTSSIDPLELLDGGLAWLGNELIEITGFDTANDTIAVNRGMIDTVPDEHAPGDRIWVYGQNTYVLDPTVRVEGEVVGYKLLTETSKGQLDENQAPLVSYTLVNRVQRPYPAGNLKILNDYFPQAVNGDEGVLSLTWAHRDRTQQLAPSPVLFTDGDVGDGTGRLYGVEVENEEGITVVNSSLGTVTSFDYASEAVDLNKPVNPAGALYRRTTVLSDQGKPLFIGGELQGIPYVYRPIQFDSVTGYIEAVREYTTTTGQILRASGSWVTDRQPFNISARAFNLGQDFYSNDFRLGETSGTNDYWTVYAGQPGVFLKLEPNGGKSEVTLPWKDTEEVKGTFVVNNQVVSFSQTSSTVARSTLPPSAPGTVISPLGDSTGDDIFDVTITDTHVVATTWGRIISTPIGSEGATWSVLYSGLSGEALKTLDYGPGGIVSAGVDNGTGKVWLSTDGGGNWTEIASGKGFNNAFWFGTRLFAIGESFIDYSDDDGSTWSSATINGTETPAFHSPMKNMTSLAILGGKGDDPSDQYGGTVYTSSDNGLTWDRSLGVPTGSALFTGAQSGSDWIVFGRKDVGQDAHVWIIVSTDGGATWTELTDLYDGFLGAVSDCCVVNGYWFGVFTNVFSQSKFLTAPVGSTGKFEFDEAGGNLNYLATLLESYNDSILALGTVDDSGYQDLTSNTTSYQEWFRTSSDMSTWSSATTTPVSPLDTFATYQLRNGFDLGNPTGHLAFANGYYYTGHKGARIYRSSDLVNWEICDTPRMRLSRFTFEHVRVILSDGQNVVALVFTDVQGGDGYETYDQVEIWSSTDGFTFTKTYGHDWDVNGDRTHDQGIVTDTGFVFYGPRGLLVSEDDGQTWNHRVTQNVPFALFTNATLIWMQGDYDLSGVLKASSDYAVTQSDAKPDDLVSSEVVTPPTTYRLNDQLRVKLDVVENGMSGYQAHDHEFKRVGYGYRYGEYYGGTL